ncbi:hypothetical protein CXF83_05255 [Shewanella sp. Choline-02u-19]|uniref:hypothetical protein n=1 Tax=unclassified Shewanella TaxID=196818 RepID=UPI000C33E54F|nr:MULTISPECIES: hypothetical protein [unclassified Shewanella]PKH56255.1 hypothetical protein CXF84_13925 [Shewanella sp. Bg11-22]PKI30049.1 hypothetical protein CXF83_05255 [Shewanella sp. Choline-02u-19]
MVHRKVIVLLDKAIEAGEKNSYQLGDIYDDLDLILGTNGKEAALRYYFDCWADAVNHDYMVYKVKDPKEWIDAATELRNWYDSKEERLSERALWKEALPADF